MTCGEAVICNACNAVSCRLHEGFLPAPEQVLDPSRLNICQGLARQMLWVQGIHRSVRQRTVFTP